MSVLNLPPPSWMTEDLVLLEEQARRFIATEYVPHLDTWNEQGMYGREVWTKAGSAGLLCPAIPEEYGGAGGSFAHEAVIGRELSLAGFDSFGAPLHSGIVAPYILHYGTDEQKRRWLPKLVTGELVGAIAMSEPGTGSDLQGVRTTAKKSGNGYVLNGSKTFITNGQHANLIIVVAKTDASAGTKGVSLMVLETEDAMGFRRGRKLKKLGLDSADTSELFFEDVKLPAESLLGSDEGQGFAQLMSDLPRDADFVVETLEAVMIAGHRRREEFESDRLAEFDVIGAKNFAHTAAAEHGHDAKPIAENGAGEEAAVSQRCGTGWRARWRARRLLDRGVNASGWRAAGRAESRSVRQLGVAGRTAHGGVERIVSERHL